MYLVVKAWRTPNIIFQIFATYLHPRVQNEQQRLKNLSLITAFAAPLALAFNPQYRLDITPLAIR